MKILLNKNTCLPMAGIFLALVLTISAFAQTEKQIAAIRTEVAAINKDAAKYKKIKKNIEDISLEGTEATFYFAADDLKKITAKIYGESFNSTGEFYYRGGALIFVYIKQNQYKTSIGSGAAPQIARVEEQRFYFAEDKLVRLVIGKKELLPYDERYSELKNSIDSISSKLKNT